MVQANQLIAAQYRNADLNKRNFGDSMYFVSAYDVFPDGSDATAKLQELVNLAQTEGKATLFFPHGAYRVTSLYNTDGIVFLGDNSTFIGGYDGVISNFGEITGDFSGGMIELNSIPSSKLSISTDEDRIRLANLSQEVLQAMAGTTPINSIPADKSVTPDKTSFMQTTTNLFNPAAVEYGIVHSANGTIVYNESYYASGYIPVSVGTVYKATKCADYAYYNSSKVFVSGVVNPIGPSVNTLTPPAGAAYVRITIRVVDLNTTMVCKNSLPSSYVAYGTNRIDITDQGFIEAINRDLESGQSKWSGKTWNVVGDSITEHNSKTTKNYQDYISAKIGCTVNNYGISGTGWRTPSVSGGTNAFYQRVPSLAAGADLITVFGGVNDWYQVGIPFVMGTFGDTDPAASFYGAVNNTITQLVTKYPTKTIAIITPIPCDNAWAANSAGVTLDQIAEAINKVAKRYSLPVLNLYHHSNVYAWDTNYKAYAMPDGLHPNDNGHLALADKILAFINSL
ncbi:lysophospholipase L1-like esterase [Paenibacillus sp. 4624]|uniref:SGNH/GDSL hydrolase family protein n=1 Tax=Paenibacillus sp. 4624 TaxID=3156453 RepID=UPI003D199C0D